jgi:hypothetical protein
MPLPDQPFEEQSACPQKLHLTWVDWFFWLAVHGFQRNPYKSLSQSLEVFRFHSEDYGFHWNP